LADNVSSAGLRKACRSAILGRQRFVGQECPTYTPLATEGLPEIVTGRPRGRHSFRTRRVRGPRCGFNWPFVIAGVGGDPERTRAPASLHNTRLEPAARVGWQEETTKARRARRRERGRGRERKGERESRKRCIPGPAPRVIRGQARNEKTRVRLCRHVYLGANAPRQTPSEAS